MRLGKDRDTDEADSSSKVECFELDGFSTNLGLLGTRYRGNLDVFRRVLRRQEKQPSPDSESSSLLFLMSSVW